MGLELMRKIAHHPLTTYRNQLKLSELWLLIQYMYCVLNKQTKWNKLYAINFLYMSSHHWITYTNILYDDTFRAPNRNKQKQECVDTSKQVGSNRIQNILLGFLPTSVAGPRQTSDFRHLTYGIRLHAFNCYASWKPRRTSHNEKWVVLPLSSCHTAQIACISSKLPSIDGHDTAPPGNKTLFSSVWQVVL
jgi:hypothetical protein